MMRSMADMLPEIMSRLSQRLRRPYNRSARSLVGLDEHGLPRYRVICPWCFGSGGTDCACRGSVLVCPDCRGARIVRQESADGSFLPPVPCATCTDWYRRAPNERYDKNSPYRTYAYAIDQYQETQAIARYLANYPEVLDILQALGAAIDEWTG